MKQKSKAVLMALGVVLLLLIAGCGKKEEGISKNDPFLGGTKGLDIKFLKDAPPDEITDGGIFPFRVVLGVKNEGEFLLDDRRQVKAGLKGFLPEDFGTNVNSLKDQPPADVPTPRQKDAEGNIIEAVETFVTFPPTTDTNDLRLGADKIKGNADFLFRADVCYKYGTEAVGKICILQNMISPAEDAICNPRGEKAVFSSSSPLQVTKFRQTVVGERKLQFSFDIEHEGKGKLFEDKNPTTKEAVCPTAVADVRLKEDEVHVTVKTGLGTVGNLVCIGLKPQTVAGEVSGEELKLVNGKRTITCTQDTTNINTDLERNVNIQLRFNYLDNIEKKILAKHFAAAPIISGPPPVGLKPVCGMTGAPSNTHCKASACREFHNDCEPITIADPPCRCDSGFVCQGSCTDKPGVQDQDQPIVGDIVPTYARESGTQYFVVRNVYDTQSGIKNCKLVDTREGDLSFDGRQGPKDCSDSGRPCDFTFLKNFNDLSKYPNQATILEAKCEDVKGNIRIRGESIKVKKIPVDDSERLPINRQDNSPPLIGELATDITLAEPFTRDSTNFHKINAMRILVTDIKDEESGIESCKLFLAGDNSLRTQNDQIIDPRPGGGTLGGSSQPMDFLGPSGCRGVRKPGGTEDIINGPCTATTTLTLEQSQMPTILQAFIECTNGATQQTDAAKRKGVRFIPITVIR